ncbi:MAG: beta strand repeat-containing protein [Deltaproteobacteria bacterium]
MNRRIVTLATLTATALACGPKKVPPPAPDVQATAATTELATQVVTGTAEYLSTVAVSRTPAFTSGETAPASVVADQYSARFQMTLPLQLGKNVFSFTATDPNGTSTPTSVTITRTAAAPAGLTLLPLSPIVTGGNLILRATITNPEPISLSGFEIDFVATPGALGAADGGAATGAITGSAKTDAGGIAQVTLQGLQTAGPWTVVATSKDNPLATDSAQVIVNGGFGTAQLDLVLEGTDATGKAVTSANGALTVAAGTSVTAKIAPAGQDQGPYLSVPFTLSTNAPHQGLFGNTISGLDVASQTPYQVAATVQPSAATGEQLAVLSVALTVAPAAPDHFKLSVAPRAVAGATVPVGVEVQDAYENDYALTAVPQIATSDTKATVTQGSLSGGLLAGAQIAFASAGSQTVTVTSTEFASLTKGNQATVAVVPGAAAALTLTLLAGGSAVTPSTQLSPNTAITIQTVVSDALGNPIPGAAVSVQTDAPGILALPSLTGVVKAGSYHVVANVTGTAISQVAPFTVVPGPTTKIVVTLSKPQATADETVSYTAVPEDSFGNVAGDALTPSIADAAGNVIYPGATPALAQVTGNATNSAGTVQIYVANTTSGTPVTLGGAAVSVGAGAAWTLAFADATASGIKGSASLAITPGAPASVSVTLGTNAPNASATVAAGTTLAFTTTVTDDHQNAIVGQPIQLATSAPGAVVTTTSPGVGQISNLNTANSASNPYYVWATVPVTGLTSPPVQLFVTPGAASAVHLVVASSNILSGNAVPYSWTITDANGNPIDLTSGGAPVIPTLSLSSGPVGGALQSPPPVAPTFNATTNSGTGELAFTTTSPAGVYTIEAQVPASFGVAPSFQTVLVSAPQDVVPPTVSLLVTNASGASLAGGTVTNGQTIIITVSACDDTALTSLYAQVSGAFSNTFGPAVPTNGAVGGPGSACPGQQLASQTFFTTVGGSGTEQVVATATDTANNTGVSPVVTFQVNPLRVDTTWISPTNGTFQLGETSLPLNGPVGIVADSSKASDVQLYLAQNGDSNVIKYDSTADTYTVFTNTAAAGLGAQSFDIVEIAGSLYVSQNNVNFNAGGGSPSIVQIPIASATAARFSDDTKVAGMMPEGLANCPLVTSSTTAALLALDDQTGGGGTKNEQADFLSLSTGAQLTGGPVLLTTTLGATPLSNPFAGVTGTNSDGSCATSGTTTDQVFASDDSSDTIWSFKLSPSFSSTAAVTAGQNCTLNGGAGNACVRAPIGVRLSTSGNHLVWASSGNGIVGYVAVSSSTGAVTGTPATLIKGFNNVAGLAFDAAGHLYVVDNGVAAPNGGTGAVYRFTLNAGF